MLEEELLSLDDLSAKIAHAIRTRTVAAAAAGANADVPRAWSSPARPRPGAALAEAIATSSPSPESPGRGVAAIHRITRQVRACTTALSPSAASPPRSRASPYSMPYSPSSASPARSLRLPAQCNTLPESPQLRRVLDEMGILEVEQKHMQQQAELMLMSHDA